MNELAKFHQYLKDQYRDGINDINVIAVEDMSQETGIESKKILSYLEILQDEGVEYYLFDELFNGQTYTMCEFYLN